MTIESHPDCARCNNRGRQFTPAEFVAEFASVTEDKERVEIPPEIVEAGAAVDRARAEYASVVEARFKIIDRLRPLRPTDPARYPLERSLQDATGTLVELDRDFAGISARYHRLRQQYDRERAMSRYAETVAEAEAVESVRNEQRQSRFKQLVGRDKEKR